ncbi:MAG: TAXI family TRAP transporter solute-binding subunit [Flammeovirgaceae bacterium]
MIIKRFLILLLTLALFSACEKKRKYKLATSTESASYVQVGQDLVKLFELETESQFEVLSGVNLGSDLNIHLLADFEVDFALAQGNTKIKGSSLDDFKSNHHIKTVSPLYPEILFIIYPDSIQETSLTSLIRGRKIGLGPKDGGTASFMHKLLKHYGLAPNEYTPVYTSYEQNVISPEIEISCALTGYNNARIYDMLVHQGHNIFSLGDPNLAFKGSSVDGFCLINGPARPFILPKFTYMNQPMEPILTVAVDAMLFTHEDVDKYTVYHLTESLFENKQYLANKNPLLVNMREHFDLNDLNYPLHEGARMYFERNKPSFIERYSKLIGSALVAIATGLPMLFSWYQRRKKDRIDRFYKSLVELEQQTRTLTTKEELEACQNELFALRKDAYEQLINEKLDADPSFSILTNLLADVTNLLKIKKEELGNQAS